MARPVGAAVMPGGMAGAAAAVASSSTKPWSPQTVRQHASGTESLSAVGKSAPSNLGAEEASSGTTPSANGSGPSSNGSPHTPDTTAASSTRNHVDGRRRRVQLHAPADERGSSSGRRNQAAARNTTPGWDTPTSPPTPPFQTRPPTTPTNPPKGNPVP